MNTSPHAAAPALTVEPALRQRKVDPERAEAMAEAGCTCAVIAERLGCCERHARRLTSHVSAATNPAVGTRHEHRVWGIYHQMWGSYAKVAFAFGVSRQAVHAALTS